MDSLRLKRAFLSLLFTGFINNVCFGETPRVKTTCEDYAKNIFKYSQQESVNLDNMVLSGIWTSSNCETYSGPRFILRKYVIGRNGKFSADFYHYKDGWCSEPTFTVSMKGAYKIGAKNHIGGHRGEFSAKSFLLIPHSTPAFIELLKVAERYCPKARLPTLQKDKNGKLIAPKLTNYSMAKDVYRNSVCRMTFGIHLYTHKIIRILRDKSAGTINDKLSFGELPTKLTRRSYVPLAYHFPLSRSSSKCKVCRALESAKAEQIIRISKPEQSWKFEDEWTSPTCQAVSETFMSQFLTFYPLESNGKREWNLVYYFFLDSACKVASYRISAKGTYTAPKKSSKISGTFEVAFNLTYAEITPYETLIVELLKAEPEGTCGISSKWHVGYTQSVKSTRGCRMFRINIPSIEYDILKAMKNIDGSTELYTGQNPTDNAAPNLPSKRPTSFQLPLRRCGDLVTGVEAKQKSTEATPDTRKIDIYIPDFTIPDLFFKTELPKTSTQRPVKRDNTRRTAQRDVHAYSGGISILIKNCWSLLSVTVLSCILAT